MNWREDIEKVCNKINSFTFALYKLTKSASRNTAVVAYYAYVESVLRYGLIIWGNSTDINKVFVAQKKCIRSICGIPPDESCRPHFKKLKILLLTCLYVLEMSIFVKLHPHLFKQARDVSIRQNMRKPNRLVLGTVSKSARYMKNCYAMCVSIYNKLLQSMKNKPLQTFKRHLRNWLLDRSFYWLGEYFNYTDK